MIRSVARKVLARIARRAARDELFEKPGERTPTPPLKAEDTSEEDDDEPHAGVSSGGARDLAAVRGPVLLHHWATWCEPCMEELPRIEALAQALGGRVQGVSWELFDAPGPPDAAARRVARFCADQGVTWPSLVWTEGPEALFSTLDMDYQKIPQSRVVAADGEVLHEVHGPLDEAALEVVRALLGDDP